MATKFVAMKTQSTTDNNVFARRLKEIRQRQGISQRMLGMAAGLDAGVASTRMNRYETGVHSPDYLTALRIAQALNTPLPVLYCDNDELAEVIHLFAAADPSTRQQVLQLLRRSSLGPE